MEDETNTKLDILKSYVVQGWTLIPLYHLTPDGCSCFKGTECAIKNQGKHPRSEWRDPANQVATYASVLHVWGENGNPQWNVGMPTGETSGVVVLDIDGELGKASLAKLIEDTGQNLMFTRVHKTGSDGLHLFFQNPTDVMITNSNKNLKHRYPGIDIRGEGGYVVMPPSQNAKGDYAILSDYPILPLGTNLLDIILTPYQQAAGKGTPALERSAVKDRTELPTAIQTACDNYARVALGKELERFQEEYDLPGWDDLVNQVAFSCFLLANSPWNSLDLDSVYDTIYGLAPRGGDADWTENRIDKCIRSAYAAVVLKDKVRDMPTKQKEALESGTQDITMDQMRKSGLEASLVDWEEVFAFDPESIEFLPGGFVREGDYITLIGDGKVGKSVFCHDWAWRMATGQPFLGKMMENPITVLYLDRENSPQIFADHFRSYGATPQTMGSLKFMAFPPMPGLDTPEGGRIFVELVKESGAKVVFLDTVSRFIEGDENENNTWLKVYQRAIVPLREYDPTITVIRIDHFGKDKTKGGRGGSAKEQDVDNVYEMKKTNRGFALERTHTRSGIGPELVAFFRQGRALDKMWAPGETSHELIPNWSIPKGPGHVDKNSAVEMAKFLDTKCIPDGSKGWGLVKVETFLRENDFKGPKETLRQVQTDRKERGEYEVVCPMDCDHRK